MSTIASTLIAVPYDLIQGYQEKRDLRAQQKEQRTQTYNTIAHSLAQDFSLRTYDPQRRCPTIDLLTNPLSEELETNIERARELLGLPLELTAAISRGGRAQFFPEHYSTNAALTNAQAYFGSGLGYVMLLGEQQGTPLALRMGRPRPLKKNSRELFSSLQKKCKRADDTLVALLN